MHHYQSGIRHVPEMSVSDRHLTGLIPCVDMLKSQKHASNNGVQTLVRKKNNTAESLLLITDTLYTISNKIY